MFGCARCVTLSLPIKKCLGLDLIQTCVCFLFVLFFDFTTRKKFGYIDHYAQNCNVSNVQEIMPERLRQNALRKQGFKGNDYAPVEVGHDTLSLNKPLLYVSFHQYHEKDIRYIRKLRIYLDGAGRGDGTTVFSCCLVVVSWLFRCCLVVVSLKFGCCLVVV